MITVHVSVFSFLMLTLKTYLCFTVLVVTVVVVGRINGASKNIFCIHFSHYGKKKMFTLYIHTGTDVNNLVIKNKLKLVM